MLSQDLPSPPAREDGRAASEAIEPAVAGGDARGKGLGYAARGSGRRFWKGASSVGPILLLGTAGCAAATRSTISAPSAKYPTSFSPHVRDASNQVLQEKDLKTVGEFRYDYTTLHLLWGEVPLTRVHHDLSRAINAQVSEAHGQGIVNLKVTAYDNRDWNAFAPFFPFILPACSKVEVRGDIVVKR